MLACITRVLRTRVPTIPKRRLCEILDLENDKVDHSPFEITLGTDKQDHGATLSPKPLSMCLIYPGLNVSIFSANLSKASSEERARRSPYVGDSPLLERYSGYI